jgi:MFS-type transporter involved in bile tolerance (Atg22 family)
LRAKGISPEKEEQMRQTVIVAAATALITAIISIWTTTVITAHTQTRPDTALATSSVDLTHMISDANKLADEKADPVD